MDTIKSADNERERIVKPASKKSAESPTTAHSETQQPAMPAMDTAHCFQRVILAPAFARPADILQLQRTIGNRAVCALLAKAAPPRTVIQAKLMVNPPDDQYEREADHVAAEVVSRINTPGAPAVQRQDLRGDEGTLMMKPVSHLSGGEGGIAVEPDVEARIEQARGGGQPLAGDIREPMERAFGADFSGVSIHTNNYAYRMNQALQARAFTVGNDIFFGLGETEFSSKAGQTLLAHELMHVLQQRRGVGSFGDSIQLKTIYEALVKDHERIALAGEQHDEIPKAKEKTYWQAEGVKVVYENETFDIKAQQESSTAVAIPIDNAFYAGLHRSLYLLDYLHMLAKYFDDPQQLNGTGTDAIELLVDLLGLIIEQGNEIHGHYEILKQREAHYGKETKWSEALKKMDVYVNGSIVPFLNDKVGLKEWTDISQAQTKLTATKEGFESHNYKYVECHFEAQSLVPDIKPNQFLTKEGIKELRSKSMYEQLKAYGKQVLEPTLCKVGNEHVIDILNLYQQRDFEVKLKGDYMEENPGLLPPKSVEPSGQDAAITSKTSSVIGKEEEGEED
jgi:hypothetical protein